MNERMKATNELISGDILSILDRKKIIIEKSERVYDDNGKITGIRLSGFKIKGIKNIKVEIKVTTK